MILEHPSGKTTTKIGGKKEPLVVVQDNRVTIDICINVNKYDGCIQDGEFGCNKTYNKGKKKKYITNFYSNYSFAIMIVYY